MEIQISNIEIAMLALKSAKEELDNAHKQLDSLLKTLDNINNNEIDNEEADINKHFSEIYKNKLKMNNEIFNKSLFYMKRWGPIYISIQKKLTNKVCLILANYYNWDASSIEKSSDKREFLNIFKNKAIPGKELIIGLIDIYRFEICKNVYNCIFDYHTNNGY